MLSAAGGRGATDAIVANAKRLQMCAFGRQLDLLLGALHVSHAKGKEAVREQTQVSHALCRRACGCCSAAGLQLMLRWQSLPP